MKENFKERLKQLKSKKGFTLIELIVVIAVLAILVLLAAPKFLGHTKDANVAAMQADAKVLSNAALVHNVNHDVGKEANPWPIEYDENGSPTGTLEDVDVDGDGTPEFQGYAFDPTALDNVRTLANDVADYVLVVTGDNAGEVYHLTGVEDSSKNVHFGLGDEAIFVPTP